MTDRNPPRLGGTRILNEDLRKPSRHGSITERLTIEVELPKPLRCDYCSEPGHTLTEVLGSQEWVEGELAKFRVTDRKIVNFLDMARNVGLEPPPTMALLHGSILRLCDRCRECALTVSPDGRPSEHWHVLQPDTHELQGP